MCHMHVRRAWCKEVDDVMMHVRTHLCVCVCVCVPERETDRQTQRMESSDKDCTIFTGITSVSSAQF